MTFLYSLLVLFVGYAANASAIATCTFDCTLHYSETYSSISVHEIPAKIDSLKNECLGQSKIWSWEEASDIYLCSEWKDETFPISYKHESEDYREIAKWECINQGEALAHTKKIFGMRYRFIYDADKATCKWDN